MIREGKYIHISTVEEAATVIDYYKQFGILTEGLTLDNCLRYPYLCEFDMGGRKLLSGSGTVLDSQKRKVVSFEEWVKTIQEESPEIEVDISQIASELFAGM